MDAVVNDARCELCGAVPSTDIGLGTFLCGTHAREYSIRECRHCGARCLTFGSAPSDLCSACHAAHRFGQIAPDLRDRIDFLVANDRSFEALQLLSETQHPRLDLS